MSLRDQLAGKRLPSHAEARAALEALPDPDAGDVELALSYAPDVPDKLAANVGVLLDATPYGHRQMITRYALGGVAGLVVGVLAGRYLLGGK